MRNKITKLGSVVLGDKIVFRSIDILGYQPTSFPPFEGRVVTVVGFRPRYVNQILVRDDRGLECLLPLTTVEKALSENPIETLVRIQ